ncbi:DNA-processing protein DprA [Thiohalorhabdus denitrificans]|uniref:DNA-processing protein DprA n=1 Tax=Thiohalorhabdus denitrificans TaxID=381306 RepID=UPI000A9F971A|nr:DNA-processing protein DprA [Thiohalorhabdus denitrificans]
MTLDPRARAWLAIRHAPGMGERLLGRLMDAYPDPDEALAAPAAELKQRAGIPPATAAALHRREADPALRGDAVWLEPADRTLLIRTDPRYPALLAETPDPPPLLYVEGRPEALEERPALAVVGSRNASRAGQQDARDFARDLAASGFCIVSGLARGIDAAAHRGALDGGGCTVAVQGCGPDRVYPAEHTALAAEVAARGALVSEFPVGTPPRRSHFPQRNRIVSGLSLGVLVVEAGERSGALTTARWAGRQGREVLAIPGSIHSPLSRGPHALIREGAKLVETLADVAEELPPPRSVPSEAATAQEPEAATALAGEQRTVAQCVDFHPTALDQVVNRSGLTPDRVSAILLELEILGVVAAEPGGFFIRTPADGARGT